MHAGAGPCRGGCIRLERPASSDRSWHAPAGFTLFEILVVMVVIAVLASLIAPNVFKHIDEAKNVTGRPQIEMLGAALDAYRLDNGRRQRERDPVHGVGAAC
ncbi:MAG TPA: prepilin-type N-terminal cleavage/methylation domain-containing protein [Gemmatimonadales bacterium]|nr:prepilin-type N-terminal cleavage/methylation domain-containing protein [Gemmatimonadales bacterium]